MADGSIVLPVAAGSLTGRRLLLPVMPAPGETLPGYLLRNVQPNHLPSIKPILEVVGANVVLSSDCIGRLEQASERLSEAFDVPPSAWAGLWGVEKMRGGRRRLGGVWLTSKQIDSVRRRVPHSHVSGSPDKAIWMVRHLGFCPESWELLVDRCPRLGCQPLFWTSATVLNVCGHCGTPLSEAKRRTVPRVLRPKLAWLLDLFGDQARVERAMAALPPTLEIPTATDAYDMVLAIARPLRVMVDPSLHGRVNLEASDLVRACQFLLDYPRSHWDMQQHGPDVVSAFRARLETLIQYPHRPAVRSDLIKIMQYGRPVRRGAEPTSGSEWVSTTQAAAIMRIERSDVRLLIKEGLLPEDSALGGQYRIQSSIRRVHVERLRSELSAQMSLREFGLGTGLKRLEVEQLLGLDLLTATTSAASRLVHRGMHVTRASAEAFIEQIMAVVTERTAGRHIPLREAMRGVGGREKPWARVLKAALEGSLPGGLSGDPKGRIIDLRVHPITARHLVMGGPTKETPYALQPGDLSKWERAEITPSEVEGYLNCTAQDVSWLVRQGHLAPLPYEAGRTVYAKAQVEALGRRLITTREIASRLNRKPAELWPELQSEGFGGALGQGFYDRGVIEAWMVG